MTPEQFCYWLQGAFETMDEGRGLSTFDHQIRDHLKTVFHKVTPNYVAPIPMPSQPDTSKKFPWNEPPSIIC